MLLTVFLLVLLLLLLSLSLPPNSPSVRIFYIFFIYPNINETPHVHTHAGYRIHPAAIGLNRVQTQCKCARARAQ